MSTHGLDMSSLRLCFILSFRFILCFKHFSKQVVLSVLVRNELCESDLLCVLSLPLLLLHKSQKLFVAQQSVLAGCLIDNGIGLEVRSICVVDRIIDDIINGIVNGIVNGIINRIINGVVRGIINGIMDARCVVDGGVKRVVEIEKKGVWSERRGGWEWVEHVEGSLGENAAPSRKQSHAELIVGVERVERSERISNRLLGCLGYLGYLGSGRLDRWSFDLHGLVGLDLELNGLVEVLLGGRGLVRLQDGWSP